MVPWSGRPWPATPQGKVREGTISAAVQASLDEKPGKPIWILWRDDLGWYDGAVTVDAAGVVDEHAGTWNVLGVPSGVDGAPAAEIASYVGDDGKDYVHIAFAWGPVSDCPSPFHDEMKWYETSVIPGETPWSEMQLIAHDPEWPHCLAASRSVGGPPFNRNWPRPRLVIDPYLKHRYLAINRWLPNEAGVKSAVVEVWKNKNDGAGWSQVFSAPPPADRGGRDQWAPGLAVLHPGNQTHASVGVVWLDTRDDGKNDRVAVYSTYSGDGFEHAIPGWTSINPTRLAPPSGQPPWTVTDHNGIYTGMTGNPTTSAAPDGVYFIAGWADHRAGGATQVWAGRMWVDY